MWKTKIFLWLLALAVFLSIVYFGAFPAWDGTGTIYLRDYAQSFWKKAYDSFLLVILSLLATIVLTSLLAVFYVAINFFDYRLQKLSPSLWCNVLKTSVGSLQTVLSYLPTVLSAIPLFITGIFFIRYFKLDTISSKNLLYGVLCLALFNVNYFFQSAKHYLKMSYKKPFVMYARSLGLPETKIFRYYVLPDVLRELLAVLRDLLPHLLVESVVIEYTFAYNGLLVSSIQAIQYNNIYYFFMIVSVCGLFIWAFAIFLSLLENFLFTK